MTTILKFEKNGKTKIIRIRDDGTFRIIKDSNGFCFGKVHTDVTSYINKITNKGWKKISEFRHESLRKTEKRWNEL